ncbi:MAG TPA: cytochrome-c peroxidase [Polyangia bacterium]|nr:cytochrome-c peroxidase [Polyangia bacterium]
MKSRVGFGLLLAIAAGGCAGQSDVEGGSGTGGFIGSDGSVDPMCTSTSISTGAAGFNGVAIPTSPGLLIGGEFPPNLGTTYSQPVAPPAVSGGTLLILADGKTAVAADPDRDRIYVADVVSRTVTFTLALSAGDEPGRVIEDAAGRVHVALRGGGALLTANPTTGTIIGRRPVCAAPRGLAYDPATDLVHVACHDGSLVSLPAAGGDAVRTLKLDDDLRDVVVSGDKLLVSRFRSAELLTVAADGTVSGRTELPAFASVTAHSGGLFTANAAWRTVPLANGSVAILHQRGLIDQVQPVAGGYGGANPCDTIVHPAITTVAADGTTQSGPALAGLVLAVDMAIAADGRVAVISLGNATNTLQGDTTGTPALTRVFVSDLASVTDSTIGCDPDGTHGPCSPGVTGGTGAGGDIATTGEAGARGTTGAAGAGGVSGQMNSVDAGVVVTGTGDVGGAGTGMGATSGTGTGDVDGGGTFTGTGGIQGCGSVDPTVPQVVGQPIAVAFDGAGNIVVQSREPAMLAFADGNNVTLSTVSREDTGHTLFHANSGGFLACGSCHSEGNEDGRTWNFNCEGERRTQSVQTGLEGTEPFHWGGDEKNFPQLMTDVFVGRMSGPTLSSDQGSALLSWLDAQPRAAKPVPADPAAVTRGQALFADPTHGCAVCHTGPHFTNNLTMDVGTGGMFQVPSLIGVGSRAPYLHNGCAKTLADRFDPACGGGDQHGITSNLSTSQISDLVAYLSTI